MSMSSNFNNPLKLKSHATLNSEASPPGKNNFNDTMYSNFKGEDVGYDTQRKMGG